MSDWSDLLREKRLGREKIIEIQTKAIESPYVYRVLCYYEYMILARFVVYGVKEEELKRIMCENFLHFHINSEGSGEYYFEGKLTPILDNINGWHERPEILDYRDLPMTSFKFDKLKPISERTEE